MADTCPGFADVSDMYSKKGFMLDFFHVASGNNVKFKAFLTKLSDQYKSDWTEEVVFGRMDPIKIFKSTTRAISLSWDVPAACEEEAKLNLWKATELFRMLYPTYEATSGNGAATKMIASPIFKLKFANIIQDVSKRSIGNVDASIAGLPGTISGFTYEPDFESGFFDMGNGDVFPQTIKLNCEFTVLHTHALGWDATKFRTPGFPYNADQAVGLTETKPTANTEQTNTAGSSFDDRSKTFQADSILLGA